jgi:hypothetical protein
MRTRASVRGHVCMRMHARMHACRTGSHARHEARGWRERSVGCLKTAGAGQRAQGEAGRRAVAAVLDHPAPLPHLLGGAVAHVLAHPAPVDVLNRLWRVCVCVCMCVCVCGGGGGGWGGPVDWCVCRVAQRSRDSSDRHALCVAASIAMAGHSPLRKTRTRARTHTRTHTYACRHPACSP